MTARTPGLTIGEVARRVGVRTSALRYYERVGLLSAPARMAGQRRYAASVLDRLHLIAFAKQAGFRLGEIRKLLGTGRSHGKPETVAASWRRIVPGKLAELERERTRIEQAQFRLRALLNCRCRRPEQCGQRLRNLARGKTTGGGDKSG